MAFKVHIFTALTTTLLATEPVVLEALAIELKATRTETFAML